MPEDMITRRKLPKLGICMTKASLENIRNKALFNMEVLDHKKIRRRKLPLYRCVIIELSETGFKESSEYLQDLVYDNIELLEEDDIGFVVDLRQREDYLEDISLALQTAEREREKNNTKGEALKLLELAMKYAEKEKGIIWLAEKFFLAAIAVASQYVTDGGRLKACCKYHHATFLLEKFSQEDVEEANEMLSEVRERSSGKNWYFYELESIEVPFESVFVAAAIQLHRVLLHKARSIRMTDPARAERLARLAQRRAQDANDQSKLSEAIIETGIAQFMMKNLNNALRTFEQALEINTARNDVTGICEAKMHLSSVFQRLGHYEKAASLLTEMGELALKNWLRRHLGRALHLLGELHLRREKPELGTAHLAEAFHCFLGNFINPDYRKICQKNEQGEIMCITLTDDVNRETTNELYTEEAEQSRLMEAVSCGQENIPTYFNLLNKAKYCAVARYKIIVWKMQKQAWWVHAPEEDLIPCMCSEHGRTAVDVARDREIKRKGQNDITKKRIKSGV